MKKELLVYARWASVEQAVLLDNQVVEAEMRDIMALHNPGSGAYENAKKHRKSLRILRARVIFRLAIKRIAQEAVEEIRPHLVTAMRVSLEVGALRRMGSHASKRLALLSNESSRRRIGACILARDVWKTDRIPTTAKADLYVLATRRREALRARSGSEWLLPKRKK